MGFMTNTASPHGIGYGPIVVAEPRWLRVGSWIGCPLAGALAGWGLAAIATGVADLPWAPWQGPFELLATVPAPWGHLGMMLLGTLAGLGLAYLWWQDTLAVTVSSGSVTMKRGRRRRTTERASIAAVFLDKKNLVLTDPAGAEIDRMPSDQKAKRLRPAFRAHGYPWQEIDPYAEQFRFWVEGTPGLPLGANELFKARQKALENYDEADADQLRTELNRLGIAVREEKKRQYWRFTSGEA